MKCDSKFIFCTDFTHKAVAHSSVGLPWGRIFPNRVHQKSVKRSDHKGREREPLKSIEVKGLLFLQFNFSFLCVQVGKNCDILESGCKIFTSEVSFCDYSFANMTTKRVN